MKTKEAELGLRRTPPPGGEEVVVGGGACVEACDWLEESET